MKAVKVLSSEILIKEYKGKRVVTFKDIDYIHARVVGTAARNFSQNKQRFIEGVDYFHLSGEEVQNTNIVDYSSPKGLTLITESGYLMLVKSFTDGLAWKIQRELMNNYFRVKQLVNPNDPLSLAMALNKQLTSVLEESMQTKEQIAVVQDNLEKHSAKLIELDRKVENDITLNSREQQQIQTAVSRRIHQVIPYYPGITKQTLFSGLYGDLKRYFMVGSYKDIKRKDFDRAKKYIEIWEPKLYGGE